ncbi:unnamed protein product [Nippostrongylus brasiliensis]|uniref:GNAT family N-acetyltransferase n=1 Tax=Nippostrongylus brasiliensis TaxID=27835 RepID=A0A0N4XK61_NIPBR|nr:unnamed protein product [Nippostrongylus brasiliensis]
MAFIQKSSAAEYSANVMETLTKSSASQWNGRFRPERMVLGLMANEPILSVGYLTADERSNTARQFRSHFPGNLVTRAHEDLIAYAGCSPFLEENSIGESLRWRL